jgi:hypothetical protein
MSSELLKSASLEKKKDFTLPKGGTIISKEVRLSVEEIENGFLLRKSYDIKWTMKDSDDSNYEYFSRTWFSKDNPIQITLPDESKSLADKLD